MNLFEKEMRRMELYRRQSSYSTIIVSKDIDEVNQTSNIIGLGFVNENIVIEFVAEDKWESYVAEVKAKAPQQFVPEAKKTEPVEVQKAYETALNYDPFKKGMTGKTLRTIYETCPEWVDIARCELKNEFILEKISIIDKYLRG